MARPIAVKFVMRTPEEKERMQSLQTVAPLYLTVSDSKTVRLQTSHCVSDIFLPPLMVLMCKKHPTL